MLTFCMILYAEPRSTAQHSRLSEHPTKYAYPERQSRAEGFLSIVFPTGPCPLITAHSCFKSFSCNTCGSPRKCCKQKTYGLAKPFRCNIYKKQGGPALRRSGVFPPIPILELIPFSPSPPKPAQFSVLSSALLLALQTGKRARNDRAHP